MCARVLLRILSFPFSVPSAEGPPWKVLLEVRVGKTFPPEESYALLADNEYYLTIFLFTLTTLKLRAKFVVQ